MKRLNAKGIEVVIYEAVLEERELFYSAVIEKLTEFKAMSEAIVSNRMVNS
nr:hypothetical protein [Vibrio breoganii]